MIIVILYLLLFLLVQCISGRIKNPTSRRKVQQISVFLLLFVFFGFRDLTVLNDTVNYYQDQLAVGKLKPGDSIFSIELLSVIEPGFQVFQRFLAKYIWSDPYVINIVPSFIISLAFVRIVGRYTDKYLPLFVFVYLGLGDMFLLYTATRQALAACFFWGAIHIRQEGKRILPFIIVGLAVLFHKTAVVCFIPLILSFFQLNKRNISLLIIFVVAVSIAFEPILEILNYSESKYIGESDDNLSNSGTPIAAILIGLSYLLLFIWSNLKHKKYHLSDIDNLIIWCAIMCLFFSLGSIKILIFFRFSIFFSLFVLVYFFKVAERLPRLQFKNIKIILIWILLIRTCIVLEYRNEWYNLVPYKFYDFSSRVHDTDIR